MSEICFVCGKENARLLRSPMPKELLGPNPAGDIVEDLKPICEECNDLRKIIDSHFVTLCEDAKLYEWYRSNSKSRGDYFPPTLIYHIDIEALKELYNLIKEIAEEAHKKSEDKQARDDVKSELNYQWRKRDA